MEELRQKLLSHDYSADRDWLNYWATKAAQNALKCQAVRKHAAYGELSTLELERTTKRMRPTAETDLLGPVDNEDGLRVDGEPAVRNRKCAEANTEDDDGITTSEGTRGTAQERLSIMAIVTESRDEHCFSNIGAQEKALEPIEDAENNCFLEVGVGTTTRTWMRKYGIIYIARNGYPFPEVENIDQASQDFARIFNDWWISSEKHALDHWNATSSKALWQILFDEGESHAEDEDLDFEIYEQPTASSPDASPTEEIIKDALMASYGETFEREKGPARIHAMADRTYRMFANLTPNVIADDSTAEYHYRSSFIDRLFESCVGGDWIKWISGEIANESVSRARAVQTDTGTPSAPKHDGIGSVDLGGTDFGIAFLEVVGGTNKENKSKERADTIKVLKSMALSTNIQKSMVDLQNYTDNQKIAAMRRIGAFGIVVHCRTMRLYAAKYINEKIVISETACIPIPLNLSQWRILGRLLREVNLLRIRCGHLYQALRKITFKLNVIPSSSITVTPNSKKSLKTKHR
ncbi:hypothetical protein HDU85_002755 [Gaertneriomyces sp. JEL0708]|nr:hypothetical protein HDU85_002755 [Gaertneriomyces sp. JEL0708]